MSLQGLFNVEWDFPNVEPPDYLLHLNPAIYEQERARVANRFEEAVQLAEQAFIAEFAKVIQHLTERLSNTGDGDRKIFRDTAITNLTEFFERFRQLNVRSNVERASHVEPDPVGHWWADLAPVGGPLLGPFDRRSEALQAESTWLETNWLAKTK
ncbi:MAG: hypothetical protein L0Y70_13925 [Gemmataceae bacterium]|nr:hypothetical protein [Gemmataceae bacterium]